MHARCSCFVAVVESKEGGKGRGEIQIEAL
jgi:hypothetical protein